MTRKEIYKKIKTPEELYQFMQKYMQYGYISKNKEIYTLENKDFQNNWWKEYRLASREEILQYGVGTCWDQVELERDWFLRNNQEFLTFYEMVYVKYTNPYPTHTFLVYKDKMTKQWCWFENADDNNRGIHRFSNLQDLIKSQRKQYILQLGKLCNYRRRKK